MAQDGNGIDSNLYTNSLTETEKCIWGSVLEINGTVYVLSYVIPLSITAKEIYDWFPIHGLPAIKQETGIKLEMNEIPLMPSNYHIIDRTHHLINMVNTIISTNEQQILSWKPIKQEIKQIYTDWNIKYHESDLRKYQLDMIEDMTMGYVRLRNVIPNLDLKYIGYPKVQADGKEWFMRKREPWNMKQALGYMALKLRPKMPENEKQNGTQTVKDKTARKVCKKEKEDGNEMQ